MLYVFVKCSIKFTILILHIVLLLLLLLLLLVIATSTENGGLSYSVVYSIQVGSRHSIYHSKSYLCIRNYFKLNLPYI